MSIQTELITLFANIADGRVYPSIAPDNPITPYIIYSRLTSVPQNDLDINGGANQLTNTRYQIDVYAETYTEAQENLELIKTALLGWSVTNVINADRDMYEQDTKLHRVLIDISTWHNS
ncbi:MAG: DUF3168 domain-containing protein [Pseudomonadota bacterium]